MLFMAAFSCFMKHEIRNCFFQASLSLICTFKVLLFEVGGQHFQQPFQQINISILAFSYVQWHDILKCSHYFSSIIGRHYKPEV